MKHSVKQTRKGAPLKCRKTYLCIITLSLFLIMYPVELCMLLLDYEPHFLVMNFQIVHV